MEKFAFLYKIILCTDGAAVYMCLHLILANIYAACYWLNVHQL